MLMDPELESSAEKGIGPTVPDEAEQSELELPDEEPEEGPLVPLEELITDIKGPPQTLYVNTLRRLLPDALNNSWQGPGPGRPFLIAVDVGLFPESRQTVLSPDIMLGVDVTAG